MSKLTDKDLPTDKASLREIQAYIKKMMADRGFLNNKIPNEMMMLTEEVGELSKALREHIGGRFDEKTSRKDVKEEFADILVVLMVIANLLEIDIYDAFIEKEKVNFSRNWKKIGGKE